MRNSCPIKQTLNLLGNKWVPMIIRILNKNPGFRPSEFLRTLPGLQQKVLTRAINLLEKDGYVKKVDYGIWPKKVEYFLTKKGEDFAGLINLIEEWSEENEKNNKIAFFDVEAYS
ncbi:hypothetical protein A7979_02760 [Rothia nasimurium]|uniref:HTH hxlR-type domain-containing protein n=1 Tax=Rothia nasimurium TaxID=85336 RepID=A0A1Y1RPW5_9MICC|nr:helix-turn-helix domain-containing protein [Rothia nasimurium]ORC18931.1 hypothetical protein A7979_02760 [Rothia nasimurium]